MVQKPKRGRYITLEDVRVSYKAKDDTIHLTSSDPDIPNSSFYMTLNKGTSTEEALREVLIENGLIREDQPTAAIEPPKPVIGEEDAHLPELVWGMMAGSPKTIFASGSPGSGKSFVSLNIAYIASKMGMPTILLLRSTHSTKVQDNVRKILFSQLPAGTLNPFSKYDNGVQQQQKVLTVVKNLLGADLLEKDDYQPVLEKAIQIASRNRKPSLSQVKDLLLAFPDYRAEALGEQLSLLSELPNAAILFAPEPSNKEPFSLFSEGTTSVFLGELDLPSDIELPRNYSLSNSFAAAVQASLLANIMADKASGKPRLLFVDNYLPHNAFLKENLLTPEALETVEDSGLSTIFVSHAAETTLKKERFLFHESTAERQTDPARSRLRLGEFVWESADGTSKRVAAIKVDSQIKEFVDTL